MWMRHGVSVQLCCVIDSGNAKMRRAFKATSKVNEDARKRCTLVFERKKPPTCVKTSKPTEMEEAAAAAAASSNINET
ncbi:hypothetical protein Ddye_027943 [Dipteronia dyeriana]|uniref:Uncharacterized protein n=1 Tax=Dipteronia dyeriana TaxID=168575 RepID=A0AAD9TQX5_9ROSI|nr:hypothetical protein Ddye_027943 [Dipteronia dyeriana]